MLLNIQNQQIEIEKPMRLEDIIKTYDSNQSIYAGIVDGKLCELTYRIEKNASIEWVKKDSMIGKQIYERTLTFVFIVAVKQLFKNANIHIEFTFQDVIRLRQNVGLNAEGTRNMLTQWKFRNYITDITDYSYRKLKFRSDGSDIEPNKKA